MNTALAARYVYRFAHRARVVEVGPYANSTEAKDAFQRVYGYWPGDAVEVTLWKPERAS